MSAPRFLLDTNVLIYCFDEREPTKKDRALRVVERVGRSGNAALPAQALSEFSNVALYKLEPPLTPEEVYRQIERYEMVFTVLPLSPSVVLEAVRGLEAHKFSYFDAQIWAAAKLGQIPIILSEDFPTGASVEGVTFVNPLSEDFDLAEL